MSSNSYSIEGKFTHYTEAQGKGPAEGEIAGKKVTLWPTVFKGKDSDEKVTNPALAHAESGETGLWTGYSKMKEYTDRNGDNRAVLEIYITGFEAQDKPKTPDWNSDKADGEVARKLLAIADELAAIASEVALEPK